MTPLAIDLFCGLGGWTEGLLAEGYRVVGFDIERHRYRQVIRPVDEAAKLPGNNGPRRWADRQVSRLADANKGYELMETWSEYPAQLVIQDVLTLHGRQFKDAALIVASPPCQEYSYMAMPWSRAKAIAAEYRSGARDVGKLTALFDACFRIQREAAEAAGRHIPLVVENVRGAEKWVGRARWNFGSFYLWGDVPALMPITMRGRKSAANSCARLPGAKGGRISGWPHDDAVGQKGIPHRPTGHWTNPEENGTKQGGDWFNASQPSIARLTSSNSNARKAASAMIAKIPLALSRHIAQVWKPRELCI